jgi:hypothetical protein
MIACNRKVIHHRYFPEKKRKPKRRYEYKKFSCHIHDTRPKNQFGDAAIEPCSRRGSFASFLNRPDELESKAGAEMGKVGRLSTSATPRAAIKDLLGSKMRGYWSSFCNSEE